jgi:hypothetical protein
MCNLWSTFGGPPEWEYTFCLDSHNSFHILKACTSSSGTVNFLLVTSSPTLRMARSAYPAPATDLTAPSQKPLTRLQPSLAVRGSASRKKVPLILPLDHREELIRWTWTSPACWRLFIEWLEGIPTVEDINDVWSEHGRHSEIRGLTTTASLRMD